MSARHVGVPKARTEQPGRRLTISIDGVATLTTIYEVPADMLVSLLPALGSKHPDFATLLLHEITSTSEEGDMATMTCVYKGVSPAGGGGESRPVYELINSTGQEPLATHPLFKDLTPQDFRDVEKAIDNPTDGLSPAFTGAKLKYYLKRSAGVESYLVRGVVWRETKVGPTAYTNAAQVGKIDTPPGNPPSLGDTANWLLIGATATKEGGAWRSTRDWQASGPKAWDPDLFS